LGRSCFAWFFECDFGSCFDSFDGFRRCHWVNAALVANFRESFFKRNDYFVRFGANCIKGFGEVARIMRGCLRRVRTVDTKARQNNECNAFCDENIFVRDALYYFGQGVRFCFCVAGRAKAFHGFKKRRTKRRTGKNISCEARHRLADRLRNVQQLFAFKRYGFAVSYNFAPLLFPVAKLCELRSVWHLSVNQQNILPAVAVKMRHAS